MDSREPASETLLFHLQRLEAEENVVKSLLGQMHEQITRLQMEAQYLRERRHGQGGVVRDSPPDSPIRIHVNPAPVVPPRSREEDALESAVSEPRTQPAPAPAPAPAPRLSQTQEAAAALIARLEAERAEDSDSEFSDDAELIIDEDDEDEDDAQALALRQLLLEQLGKR